MWGDGRPGVGGLGRAQGVPPHALWLAPRYWVLSAQLGPSSLPQVQSQLSPMVLKATYMLATPQTGVFSLDRPLLQALHLNVEWPTGPLYFHVSEVSGT